MSEFNQRQDGIDKEKILVLIPAFNESRFIGSVILQALAYARNVVVVDDGSTDDTVSISEAAGAHVIRHERNMGKGAALNSGFRYARYIKEIEAIITIDGDGQHKCSDIPVIVEPILKGTADIVVGSRFLETKSKIPLWRIFGQRFLTLVTNIGSNSNITDSQSGFRAFSRHVLDVFHFESKGFSVESEMQFMWQKAGLRVVEAPVSVVYAEKEIVKRNPFAQGTQVINGILHFVSQYRPLLFFGGGGMILLIAGMLWGFYVVQRYFEVGTLPVGYALITVLLLVIGSASFFAGLMLHTFRGLLMEVKGMIESLRDSN